MKKSNKNKFVHETAIIDSNVKIGVNTKIWHWSHISEDAIIGKNCIIGQGCFIGKRVVIGDNCRVQNNVSIFEGVFLEESIFVGPGVTFTNVKFPRSYIDQKKNFKVTKIEKGASLGANSTIVCGVKIGKYSMIGAGSVVTKNVEPYSLFVGSPAKFIKKISKNKI